MHPNIRQGLPFFREPNHVGRRRVVLRSARSAFQCCLKFPNRYVPRPADMLKRNAGLGFAATTFHLQPAVTAIEALSDRRRRPAISFHADRPCFGLGAIGFADRLGAFACALGANVGAGNSGTEYDLQRLGAYSRQSQRPLRPTQCHQGRIRHPERPKGPTGSAKCVTYSIQEPPSSQLLVPTPPVIRHLK
jgi:hypothetical protein